jgi:hypothetical protein
MAEPGVRAAGKTNARQSVSSPLVKYNIIVATIFMTFRRPKKFDKNGFHTLQSTTYVPPAIDQNLKFKCVSILHRHVLHMGVPNYNCLCSTWTCLQKLHSSCSARDWDGKDYLRIIPRVVW